MMRAQNRTRSYAQLHYTTEIQYQKLRVPHPTVGSVTEPGEITLRGCLMSTVTCTVQPRTTFCHQCACSGRAASAMAAAKPAHPLPAALAGK